MNETTPPTPPPAAVTVQPKREIRVVEDDSENAYLLDTGRFEHTCRIAGMMARANLIPKHLKGDNFEQTQANCFLVVNQAFRWKLDPFAIAPETYEVGGKLGFQGKLIAAVINARAGLVEKLTYTFNDKTGDALEVTVSGRLKGEDKPRTVTVSVGQARTTNQMWTKDPQQKLIYSGATKWARRHVPEVILGVLTDDDAEQIREEAKFIAAKPVEYKLTDMMPPPGIVEASGSIGGPLSTLQNNSAAEPPPLDPAKLTPQARLEYFVVGDCGKDFATFKKWAEETGNLQPEPFEVFEKFADLPAELCARVTRSPRTMNGLRSGLEMVKGSV